MAVPNGRGGWDLSDEESAMVSAAGGGGPVTVLIWPAGGDPVDGEVFTVQGSGRAGVDPAPDPPEVLSAEAKLAAVRALVWARRAGGEPSEYLAADVLAILDGTDTNGASA